MALDILPYHMTWRDAKGFTWRNSVFIAEDNGAGGFPGDMSTLAFDLQAAIAALTNCAFQGASGLDLSGPYPGLTYGTNAQYPAGFMKAVMQFSTDFGNIMRLKIPAPKIAIMETDGVTVINDGTNAAVVAFVNAVKNAVGGAHVTTRTGVPFTHFEGGIVKIGRQPRRFNERVKSAKLVAGEGE